jgi:hypothetical protein
MTVKQLITRLNKMIAKGYITEDTKCVTWSANGWDAQINSVYEMPYRRQHPRKDGVEEIVLSLS